MTDSKPSDGKGAKKAPDKVAKASKKDVDHGSLRPVTLADHEFCLSISGFAKAFVMARATVSKAIADHDVRPATREGGYGRFRLRDVVPLLFGQKVGNIDARTDPAMMTPTDRRAHYQALNEQAEFEKKTAMLIPASEFEAFAAELVKSMTQFTDTMGDHLEREVGLTPEQVEAVHESAVRFREQAHATLRRAFDTEDESPAALTSDATEAGP